MDIRTIDKLIGQRVIFTDVYGDSGTVTLNSRDRSYILYTDHEFNHEGKVHRNDIKSLVPLVVAPAAPVTEYPSAYTLTVPAQDMPMILGALREMADKREAEGKAYLHFSALRMVLINQRDAQNPPT